MSKNFLSKEKSPIEKIFHDLKIIYHGSESGLKTEDGFNYQPESIFTCEKQKIWPEFFSKIMHTKNFEQEEFRYLQRF